MQKYKLFFIFALFGQLVVPPLAKTSHKGLFQILVQRLALGPALLDGAAANIPFVVVYRLKIAIIFDADRIEVARNRLLEINLPVAECLFYRAERQAIFDNGVCAFAVVYQRRARQSVDIDGRHPVALNDGDAIGGHIGFNISVNPLKDRNFVLLEWRATVALNAAGALALRNVAAETDISKIVGYYTVVND